MSNSLKKFLENVSNGLVHSPYYSNFADIENVIDDSLALKIQEALSELSGAIITKLADEFESRGLARDGHKIVKGFAEGIEDENGKDHDEEKEGKLQWYIQQ